MAMHYKWMLRLRQEAQLLNINKFIRTSYMKYCTAEKPDNTGDDEFRVLEIMPPKKHTKQHSVPSIKLHPPRTTKMSPDQDWTNVWPAPRTFHPAVVPLPVRQGLNKHGPSPDKYANTELMKIPNFLHLTPPAIKKHCEALKKFCTPWPVELKNDIDIENHFPVEVIDSDYCHSSPSIRDPSSRIITIKIKLKYLHLDKHAKDKFLRLVGPRYDPKSDYVTLTTDSCPMKQQNYDYAQYLLTASMFESWKYEKWENEKTDDDMEEYIFSQRPASKNIKHFFEYSSKEVPDTTKYAKATEDFYNKGDDKNVIENYKKAALELLSIPAF